MKDLTKNRKNRRVGEPGKDVGSWGRQASPRLSHRKPEESIPCRRTSRTILRPIKVPAESGCSSRPRFPPISCPRAANGVTRAPWPGPLWAPGTVKLALLLSRIPSPPLPSLCQSLPKPWRRWGRAWLGEARAFQRAERAKATKEPGSRWEKSGGCGALGRRWRLGRGLAQRRSRGASPPPPARAWPPSQGREVVLMVEEGMELEIGGPGGSRG